MLKSKTSAKRLVTVDGVEKSRSHVARTGWFPQLFRGGRYLTELFYAIVTSLKCGEHQRPDIFTASNFNGLIRSHVLEPNISDASFPSFISIPLSFLIFHFYLRVLLFFLKPTVDRILETFSNSALSNLVIASCRYSRETNYRRGESLAGNLNVSSIGESWNCADFMQLHDCI